MPGDLDDSFDDPFDDELDDDDSFDDDASDSSSGLPPQLEWLREQIHFQRANPARAPEEPEFTRVGKFELLELLGVGGYGLVYLARDLDLGRLVALKLWPQSATADTSHREAELIAQFSHPNIVTVFEIGHDEIFGRRICYYVMEYVRGCDGRRCIGVSTSWKQVIALFEAAAAGLHAAHRQGIVHGDFKPENLLIGVDGRVRVADFGLGRRIRDSANENDSSTASYRLGTPDYLAPELWYGQAADARSDQFAFCVALWEFLFRRRPFNGNNPEEWLAVHRAGPPVVRLTLVPRAIQDVLRKGLSFDPGDRYPDMDALARALREITVPAPDRRSSSGLTTALVLTAVLLLGSVGGLIGGQLLLRGSSGGAFVDHVVSVTAGVQAVSLARAGNGDEALRLFEVAQVRASESQLLLLAITSQQAALELEAHGDWTHAALIWSQSARFARRAGDRTLEQIGYEALHEANQRALTTAPRRGSR